MSSVRWAAIGSDGTRPVVWSVGSTRWEAYDRALIAGQVKNDKELYFVPVDAETEARIARGIVDARRLGIFPSPIDADYRDFMATVERP